MLHRITAVTLAGAAIAAAVAGIVHGQPAASPPVRGSYELVRMRRAGRDVDVRAALAHAEARVLMRASFTFEAGRFRAVMQRVHVTDSGHLEGCEATAGIGAEFDPTTRRLDIPFEVQGSGETASQLREPGAAEGATHRRTHEARCAMTLAAGRWQIVETNPSSSATPNTITLTHDDEVIYLERIASDDIRLVDLVSNVASDAPP